MGTSSNMLKSQKNIMLIQKKNDHKSAVLFKLNKVLEKRISGKRKRTPVSFEFGG